MKTKEAISAEFTCTPGLYEITGSKPNIKSQMSCRIDQLEAMLANTSGEQGETFRMLNDDLQENFMWACNLAIREIRQLWQLLEDEKDGGATSAGLFRPEVTQ